MSVKWPNRSINVQLHPEDYEFIEDWRRSQKDMPSRAEVLRRFALQGIKSEMEAVKQRQKNKAA